LIPQKYLPKNLNNPEKEKKVASEYSFDIASKVDVQEVDNAVNQTKKMLLTRYDLKGTKCAVDLDKKELKIQLKADDNMKHETLLGILKERLASRNVSLKALKPGIIEQGLDGTVQQLIEFQNGIPADTAKDITRLIREMGVKVQPQIQSDQIRVTAKSKDDLQQVMSNLREKDLTVSLQFINFR
jgi:uncharacterized protein YajQ (UPF0234 family)